MSGGTSLFVYDSATGAPVRPSPLFETALPNHTQHELHSYLYHSQKRFQPQILLLFIIFM